MGEPTAEGAEQIVEALLASSSDIGAGLRHDTALWLAEHLLEKFEVTPR
ncbi:MAG: hypothetical protein QM638_01165 [Nocardioides sp.]